MRRSLLLISSVLLIACANQSSPREAFVKEWLGLDRDWGNRLEEFKHNSAVLLQEIELLANHPGWVDMTVVIKGHSAITYLEGEESANLKTDAALGVWADRWKSKPLVMIDRYLALCKNSKDIFEQRNILIDEWREIHRKRVSMLREQIERGNLTIRMMDSANKLNDAAMSVLNSYRISSFGLLERT